MNIPKLGRCKVITELTSQVLKTEDVKQYLRQDQTTVFLESHTIDHTIRYDTSYDRHTLRHSTRETSFRRPNERSCRAITTEDNTGSRPYNYMGLIIRILDAMTVLRIMLSKIATISMFNLSHIYFSIEY